MFKLVSKNQPAGDQPKAIESLIKGILNGKKDQVLLGATGTGKTFTIANVISQLNRPTLIMAHNKTLAAQLYSEMKEFFPENAVEYFVSYYDYYQPEAYIAKTDTYIEKDSAINDKIDMLRYSATKSLLEKKDVIVVSSVSSIYGLGAPEECLKMRMKLKIGEEVSHSQFISQLIKMQYQRTQTIVERGQFRVNGDVFIVFEPSCDDVAIRIEFFGDTIEAIYIIDALTMQKIKTLEGVSIYPNTMFSSGIEQIKSSIDGIMEEMKIRVRFFQDHGMILEANRISQRTRYDVEMMLETGSCKGIENYSRHLTARRVGEAPPTLFEYLPKDGLLIVDESHVTVPQIGGMFAGDRSRKESLVQHGFRLPSALDNRPLKLEEWDIMRPQTVFVSATPGKIEMEKTNQEYIEQIIRPTGLLDPVCEIRSTETQMNDMINEILLAKEKGEKVLCIALTKKHAEKINERLNEIGIASKYIHSDVETLDRIDILHALKLGKIDVLIGINLLREGIDLPECALVGILDADKEGFLRSKTSLVQIIGRVARNSNGRVILYADKITESIKYAISETNRRREIQMSHNLKHGITPTTIKKIPINVFDAIFGKPEDRKNEKVDISKDVKEINPKNLEKYIRKLKAEMKKFAKDFRFEEAQSCKDKIKEAELMLVELLS